MRTADQIEEMNAQKETGEKKPEKRQFDPAIGLATQFKPGVSGNPGGRPKKQVDLAAEMCRQAFEQAWEKGVIGCAVKIAEGNPYAIKEYGERAYGKLLEKREVTHIHGDTPDEDLAKEVEELERKLGLAREIDDASRIGIAQARGNETSITPQATDVLP